jgi:hypothetical protein
MSWVSEPDDGQVDALLKGLRFTTGGIVTWLNADDIYLSEQVITRVVDTFKKNPSVGWITGTGLWLDESGRPLRPTRYQPERVNFESLRLRNFVLQPATFLRRSLLEELPLDPSLHYAFDWDLWIRAAKTYPCLAVPERWAGYRWWSGSKTASRSARRVWEQAEVTRRYVGPASWQYRMLRAYGHLFELSERLPPAMQGSIKLLLHRSSSLLSRMSGYRIAVA